MAKGTFSKTVNLRYRKDGGKDIDDKVQDLLEQHLIAEEALEIVNGREN